MGSGILTEKLREYLRGDREVPKGTKWSYDSRIRDRTRDGIHDFSLLFKRLPNDHRKQIFEKTPKSRDAQVRVQNAIIHSTRYMIAFAYLGMLDRGFDSDDIARIFEDGIRLGENKREEGELPEEGELLDVKVSIKVQRAKNADVDALKDRFNAGEPLSSEQLGYLLQQEEIDADDLVEHVNGTAEPISPDDGVTY